MGYGNTLYVGRRGSGKVLRVYKKGKQLRDPQSHCVRVKVGFHNKGRTIPLNVITSSSALSLHDFR
jgi:phage replication initiation protein